MKAPTSKIALWIALLLAIAYPEPQLALATPLELSGYIVEQIKSEALPCSNPRPATQEFSSNFKYGCFCGANHPGLRTRSGKPEASLTDGELWEHVAQYYSIRPVDDIDAACQFHDVCWILQRGIDIRCNWMFGTRIGGIRYDMERISKKKGMKDLSYRCANLAFDIRLAVQQVMPNGQGTSYHTNEAIGRVVLSPINGAMAGMSFLMGRTDGYYPMAGERCLLAGSKLANKQFTTKTMRRKSDVANTEINQSWPNKSTTAK